MVRVLLDTSLACFWPLITGAPENRDLLLLTTAAPASNNTGRRYTACYDTTDVHYAADYAILLALL